MLVNWVERDGLARTVLALLVMTTISCFAYTWGYYEVCLPLLQTCMQILPNQGHNPTACVQVNLHQGN
jgi:hypothetical protein